MDEQTTTVQNTDTPQTPPPPNFIDAVHESTNTPQADAPPETETPAVNEVTEAEEPAPTKPPATAKKTKKEKAPKKKSVNRFTRTTVFYAAENQALQTVLDARVKAGITRDWSHLLRQFADFAINHKAGTYFATPDGTAIVFKDAFFNPDKK